MPGIGSRQWRDCAEDSRGQTAGDDYGVVRRGEWRWIADRDDNRWTLRSDRLGARRRRRQPAACIQRRYGRASILLRALERSAAFSNADRDRRSPLCGCRWQSIRVFLLNLAVEHRSHCSASMTANRSSNRIKPARSQETRDLRNVRFRQRTPEMLRRRSFFNFAAYVFVHLL